MTFERSLRLLLSLLAFAAAPLALGAAASKKRSTQDSGPAYKGAIIMDAATGKILLEDKADVINPPASMAKLMTFAVVFDSLRAGNLSLSTPVTTTAADTRMGGTQVWLKEGEVFPVEELLYAMMIQSANDAAYALARTTAGSVDAFVAQMNAKARELGMTNTTFRTPHGLPPPNRSLADSDQTTPRDFALLSRHLLLNTDILKYTIRQRFFGAPNRVQLVDMVNHNHLINKVEGVDGLKTGYTKGAGFCLAATAQRSGRRVIVVVMGSNTSKERDHKVIELLEQGFTLIPSGSDPFTPVATSPAYTPAADSPFASAPLSPTERNTTGAGNTEPAPAPGSSTEEPMIRLNIPPAKKK